MVKSLSEIKAVVRKEIRIIYIKTTDSWTVVEV